jgi:thioredoxin-related protein
MPPICRNLPVPPLTESRSHGRVSRRVPVLSGRLSMLLLGLLAIGPLGAAEPLGWEPFFDQTFGDLTEELANARDQGKDGILLMFQMDACPFCQRMKTRVLSRPEVQDYFKAHFLSFPIDVVGDIEITDFSGQAMPEKVLAMEQYRVQATPVFAFFDLDGNLVARYTGATRDSDEFLLLGRYVVEKAYRRVDFAGYQREQGRAVPPDPPRPPASP